VRCFAPDYGHAAVVRWMIREAMKGFQRGDDPSTWRYVDACSCGVNLPEYPKSVSLILTRDANPDCISGWHLSVCCVTDRGYRGYVPEEGAYWLRIIFGPHADRAVEQPLEDRSRFGIEKDVRHFVLECDWADRSDPAVNLISPPQDSIASSDDGMAKASPLDREG